MMDREFFRDLELFYENRFVPIDDHEQIKFMNWLQVVQSNRQVYSNKGDFNLIMDMKKHNPKILDNRIRLEAFANGKKYEI